MKKTLKNISLLIASALIITSCNDNEDNVGASNYSFGSPVPVTITAGQPKYEVSENDIPYDETFTIDLMASIPKPQAIDAVIEFVQKNGTADSNDYSVGRILISAGSTTGATKVEINKTGDIEGNQDLVLMARSTGNFSTSFELPITIYDDHINDRLDLSATWSGSYTYTPSGIGNNTEVTIDFCDMDFDLYILDENDTELSFDGATGACNEHTLQALAPGTYYIAVDLYENPLAVLGTNQNVPITFTYSQEYFFGATELVYNGFTTDSADGTGYTKVAKIEVVKGEAFTITPL